MSRIALIAAGVLLVTLAGAGCRILTEPARPPVRQKVAERIAVGPEWVEIVPDRPLEATSRSHMLGLRVADASGWADERRESIRLRDGAAMRIEVELVETDGSVTRLYPNGFSDLVEFGKRADDRSRPDTAAFRTGSKFAKVRLRSDKAVDIRELLWMEFDF